MKKHYSYKQKDYYIQEKVEVKDRITREWYESYIYVQIETGKKFCREIKEFEKLFKFEGYIKDE